MARDIKPKLKGPKAHTLTKKHYDRTRWRAYAQGRAKGKPNANVKTRSIADVYEYAPSKVRRANIGLALDRHESGTRGLRHVSHGDDEGEMDIDITGLGQEAMEKLRARLMQDDDDDGDRDRDGVDADRDVDSADDEEIESEDAFEESDKEEFAGSGFVRGGRGGPVRRDEKRRVMREVDLSEDEDEDVSSARSVSGDDGDEDDEDGDEELDAEGSGEFFDVLDVFDGRADAEDDERSPPKSDEKAQAQKKTTPAVDEEEWRGANYGDENPEEDEEGEDEESTSGEDDELRISASDAEDPSPEALADLETFLSALDPTASKRKPDDTTAPSKKRRRVDDRTEAGEESEFGIRGASALQLDDLLAPLASSSVDLAPLKKATKLLTSSSKKTKTLAAPLPQRAQERLDREAAYEQTKEEVDKWSATMKRIKEAEHLSFPLQAEKPSRVSTLELAAKFTPSNALESAVDKLLKSAQLRDEDIAHTEALKMAHLSVEEVAARRAELRVMRELAFRADKKAKRIAKIKSKTYRRIRKKQRERLDGADAADGEEEGEEDGARLKAEVERARERATLRHKNTGKWARAMSGREGLELDQRQAISEMLDRGEKLRRRIRGEHSGDEGSGESSDEGEEVGDEDAIRRDAFEELAALRGEEDIGDAETARTGKSVFEMKFMREAAARRAREADAQAKELQNELRPGIEAVAEEDEVATETVARDAAVVQRTGGRLSFRPGATPGALRPLGSLASDTSSVTLQSTDLLQDLPAPEPTPASSMSPSPSASTATPTSAKPSVPNPWLVPGTSSGATRKRNEVRVHKDADASVKASNRLKKQAVKHADEKERARDDAMLEIDANEVLTIPEPPAPNKSGKARAKSGPTNTDDAQDDGSDVPSEAEEQERAEDKTDRTNRGVRAFQQRDLVALAFAGDNVVQTFEEAKRQETEADAPHEVDTTLPGWGSWGGTGTKKQPPKPHLVKSIPGIAPSTRADHNKPRLIISEKRDKKASKYLVRDLPHPYTSHAQFERGMEVPLGTEWNTRVGFQRGTLPRVIKKMGTVIDPLEKLF